ncbi:restriction endonuclease [Weissella muntiaci]|uniref:Restriction endonuclease n=1 Tax=Weissella muntiaci TaxID=2508881 RepID=A0A6C2C9Q7_9LACO|nr:restriction endonuclease [Weissella muntiaci]TYC50664.1 restriction endonuclease [Weissella muntiaci]
MRQAIIKALISLGGDTTRDDVKRWLVTNTDLITAETLTQEKVSKKTQRAYQQFAFPFNFSLKTLEMIGLIDISERSKIKGLNLVLAHELVANATRTNELTDQVWAKSRDAKANESIDGSGDDVEEEIVDELNTSDYIDAWRGKVLASLKDMNPIKFEAFSRNLISKMQIELDEKIGVVASGDGGLDGFGYLTTDDFRTVRVALQSKRWAGNVGSPEIDKFRGAMDKRNAEYGIFITTGVFTPAAMKAAREGTRVITLIDQEKMLDLIAKYELHVKPVITYVVDDFFR